MRGSSRTYIKVSEENHFSNPIAGDKAASFDCLQNQNELENDLKDSESGNIFRNTLFMQPWNQNLFKKALM